jgi:hypothetical protein
MKNTGASILDVPVSCIYNTGIPESLIYAQYQKLQYSSSNNTGNTSIVKHTILEASFQYCVLYNTSITSIVG